MRRELFEKMQDALQWATPFSGVCFRNVTLEFANARDILSAQGSFRAGRRFNFKGMFEVLYLSCDLHTCLEETTLSLQRDGFEAAATLRATPDSKPFSFLPPCRAAKILTSFLIACFPGHQ